MFSLMGDLIQNQITVFRVILSNINIKTLAMLRWKALEWKEYKKR